MRIIFGLLLMFTSSVVLGADVRLISVTGLVEKSFKPDIVRLNIMIWGKGDSAKGAQKNNQTHYDVLKKSIEAFKVVAADVRTTSYDLSPERIYDPKTNKNNITGYNANQGLSITLRKIDDAGPFIDSLSNSSKAMNGGVSVESLNFDIDKRREEERALMGDAVRSAEAQAESLAQAAKVKLKGLYRLAPGATPTPRGVLQYEAKAMADGIGGATNMMSGEVKVIAEVSADYIIE